jgi:hypothetical protein
MTFHPAKCYILRVTRKKNPSITNYEMLGQQLETVHQYPYLGVELSEDLACIQGADVLGICKLGL